MPSKKENEDLITAYHTDFGVRLSMPPQIKRIYTRSVILAHYGIVILYNHETWREYGR